MGAVPELFDVLDIVASNGYGMDVDGCFSLCKDTRANPTLIKTAIRLQYGKGKTTRLAGTAVHSRLERLHQYISLGANIDVRDANGFTALHWAVSSGAEASVEALLLYGASVGLSSRSGATPLSIACGSAKCGPVMFHLLLEAGADADGQAGGTQPLLQLMRRALPQHPAVGALTSGTGAAAAHGGNTSAQGSHPSGAGSTVSSATIPYLLTPQDHEACCLAVVAHLRHVNRLDSFGWSLLMHAIKKRQAGVVAALLDRGASVNARGQTNLSALTLALDCPLTIPTPEPWMALPLSRVWTAVDSGSTDSGSSGNASSTTDAPAPPSPGKGSGQGPATPQPSPSRPQASQHLPLPGSPALHPQQQHQHQQQSLEPACLQLIEAGADITLRGRDACTTLHLACLSGYSECALRLTRLGCDRDGQAAARTGLGKLSPITDRLHGRDAGSAAGGNDNRDQPSSPSLSAPHALSAQAGLLGLQHSLATDFGRLGLNGSGSSGHGIGGNTASSRSSTGRIAPSIDLNAPNIYGDTCLMAAVRACGAVVEATAAAGAGNGVAGVGAGGTALVDFPSDVPGAPPSSTASSAAAAQTGMRAVVSYLLACSATVTAKDHKGLTALHFACRHGLADVALQLLNAGADPNSRAQDGSTAVRLCQAWLDRCNALARLGRLTSSVVKTARAMAALAETMRVRAGVAAFVAAGAGAGVAPHGADRASGVGDGGSAAAGRRTRPRGQLSPTGIRLLRIARLAKEQELHRLQSSNLATEGVHA